MTIMLLSVLPGCEKPSEGNRISICKVIEHEAINSVVSGIQFHLKDKKNLLYDIETAQGNPSLAAQIAAKFANSGSSVVVAVGTTPAQCIFDYAKKGKTKLIFSSVTDPATISKSLKNSNTSGVSNFVKLEPQVDLFKKIQPELKKLGIIFNTGEANSVAIVEELRKIVGNYGIELIEQGIQKSSDIPQAIGHLAEKVDAVFISNDNTVLGGMSYVVKVCNLNKIPVYVSDTDQVEKGCLAALGPNQYAIGIQTGKMIDRVLNGEDINGIAIEYPAKTELFINLKAAANLGIRIDGKILENADKVFGN
jgi:putative ABC transport system substrate-binding protein